MADIEKFIPFVIKWETGVVQFSGETAEHLFERARKKGWSNSKLDRGGATQTGLTLAAYQAYCKAYHISTPTAENLKNIPYSTWKNVMKVDYWDRWKADEITSQGVANILVDWVWASGKYGITKPQALLGVQVDGVVGKKTLMAVNSKSPLPFFAQIRKARIDFVNNIVKNNPTQRVWLKGWLNRINDIKYTE